MHISLFTATGAYNLGDELILLQEYEYLSHRYEGATFSVFTYDSKSSLLPAGDHIQYVSYFPNAFKKHPFRNLWYFIQTIRHIRKSDLVVIGGGGILYDGEVGQSFKKQLTEWKIRIRIAEWFAKPILYWSIGVNVREENREKLLPLFSAPNTTVTVRDSGSKRLLEEIGIKAELVFDPVLTYDPEVPKLLPKRRPKVGLSFRRGYLRDEMENIEKIITMLQYEGFEPILLNHSFHAIDPHNNDSVFLSSLRSKYSLHETATIEETLEAYKELEFVIGMRLHSLILSFVHTIPFFAISYEKKTDEFIRSIGYDFILAARTFDIEVFKTQFSELRAHKQDAIFALERKNDTIKTQLANTLNTLFHGLEKTRLGREGTRG